MKFKRWIGVECLSNEKLKIEIASLKELFARIGQLGEEYQRCAVSVDKVVTMAGLCGSGQKSVSGMGAVGLRSRDQKPKALVSGGGIVSILITSSSQLAKHLGGRHLAQDVSTLK